ncbi:hypothetical protein DRW48_09410 [Paracoccus suum]|uniref:Lipoprotein n=1 Tax=Paracoccus suum TaxID=2259340 RepID=A0A344PKH3_9RHOB|nr:hypothetical protein [Paracoccus suum]AXC49878.1 hypothetical protein DRW48_09410 [Paracoccus suum]
MRAAPGILVLTLAAAVLAGCGPVPVADAERTCLGDARAARGPQSSVSVGVAGDRHGVHPVAGVSLSISSDAIAGRDPSDVFTRCVMRRSGQMPTRPLTSQPGWAG